MPLTTMITYDDECHLAIAPVLVGAVKRDVPDRSKGSEIGYVLCPRTNTALKSESGIEHNAIFVLYGDRDIERVLPQSARISLVNDNGKTVTHTIDLRARRWDRYVYGLLCKGDSKATHIDQRHETRQLAAITPKSVADELNFITDRDLPAYEVENARLMLSCRREDRDEIDAALVALAPNFGNDVSIADVCATLGAGGLGFRPIVRAILYGTLECVTEGLITPETMVRFSGFVMPDLDADGPIQPIGAELINGSSAKPRRRMPGAKAASHRSK